MTRTELIELMTRLRRSTRNLDVLALCDEVERLSRKERGEVFRPFVETDFAPKRDRAAYMREYRRRGGLKSIPANP